MRAALAASGADILVTAETPPEALAGDARLDRLYPHRLHHELRRSNWRLVLWSRFPIRRGELLLKDRYGIPSGLSAVVEFAPGHELSVLALHLPHVALAEQQAEVEALDELAAGLPRPLVVMGDLNATAWSWAVHRAERLTGTRRVGGVLRTWDGAYPTPLVAIPEPFGLPIDHILVSEGIGVAGIGTVEIPGSDHMGVRARLRVPD
jgi:endonuclease/exonuclease/phosphatase (EEP) superfamily protein YafD